MYYLYAEHYWESEIHNNYGTAYYFREFADKEEAIEKAQTLEKAWSNVKLIEGNEIKFTQIKK